MGFRNSPRVVRKRQLKVQPTAPARMRVLPGSGAIVHPSTPQKVYVVENPKNTGHTGPPASIPPKPPELSDLLANPNPNSLNIDEPQLDNDMDDDDDDDEDDDDDF